MTDKLVFRKEDHTYWVGETQVPSVTAAINLFAENYVGIPHHILEEAKDRGTAVHLATEYDDQGRLMDSILNPSLRPYVDAWRRFKKEARFSPSVIEKKVYHDRRQYAGTLDRVGFLDGKEVLLDIKTGSALRPTTGPQTAAYERAYRDQLNATDGIQTDALRYEYAPLPRFGCELHADGTYSLVEFADPNDFPVFLAALTLWRWKRRNCK